MTTQQSISLYREWLEQEIELKSNAGDSRAVLQKWALETALEKLNELCPKEEQPSLEECQRLASMIEDVNDEADRDEDYEKYGIRE